MQRAPRSTPRPPRPDTKPAQTLLLTALAALSVLTSSAQAQQPSDAARGEAPALIVPNELVRVSDGTITLQLRGRELGYVPGLGWTDGTARDAPRIREDGRVTVGPDLARALDLAHVREIRTGQDGATTRLVLDLAGVTAASLEGARRDTRVNAGEPLEIPLPGVLVPDAELFGGDALRVRSLPADGADPARIRLQGPALHVRAFPLDGPPRLVLDLTPSVPGEEAGTPPAPAEADPAREAPPVAPDDPTEETRHVAPGVSYRSMPATGLHGDTRVHVLSLDPEATELRVVGRSGEGRTVGEWAGNAVAAINAGYFRPGDFEAIGVRRIGGTLLSLPSRRRAAVGFGPDGAVIARADATVTVRLDGRPALQSSLSQDPALALSRVPGVRVGTARQGVLAVGADDRVLSNTIGPVRVPEDGYALAYPPRFADLARAEAGAQVRVNVRLEPPALERSHWVVEAGPLLVRDGRAAFAPQEEAFARGARILDEPTQQAALGVRADGTVLFVVAERMVAEDLVGVFLSLEAEHALRLDSGSSATMVVDGRPLNRLFTRRVESAIVAVLAEDAGAGR